MKLSKIIGMTAALLLGAGMTTAVVADQDRGHRAEKRGKHAKRGHDRQGVSADRIAAMKKRAMEAKKRAVAKGGQRRGPQGGPPQFAREMMKMRMAAEKGGGEIILTDRGLKARQVACLRAPLASWSAASKGGP